MPVMDILTTAEWLEKQFADRAADDQAEHTTKDAREVAAMRAHIVDMVAALSDIATLKGRGLVSDESYIVALSETARRALYIREYK